jgi:hypothetical protein
MCIEESREQGSCFNSPNGQPEKKTAHRQLALLRHPENVGLPQHPLLQGAAVQRGAVDAEHQRPLAQAGVELGWS